MADSRRLIAEELVRRRHQRRLKLCLQLSQRMPWRILTPDHLVFRRPDVGLQVIGDRQNGPGEDPLALDEAREELDAGIPLLRLESTSTLQRRPPTDYGLGDDGRLGGVHEVDELERFLRMRRT